MYDRYPKRRFGQHFLRDPVVIERIVEAFAPCPGEVVVEVGPGDGALTQVLAPRLRFMHVLEIDRGLCSCLAADPSLKHVQIHNADALRFPICGLAPHDGSVRLIGNLPYNISTPLLFAFFRQRECVHDMLFMLQEEVVARLTAEPGRKEYGRLTVMAQLFCEAYPVLKVPPSAFRPVPKVQSAVVRLVPRRRLPIGSGRLPVFDAVVRQIFSQRRKALRNSLKGLVGQDALIRIGVDPMRRPETLSLAEIVAIAEAAPMAG